MRSPTVLLVEDESLLRMDLKEMLEEAGYDVVGEAGDGEKAVELAFKLQPDCILMDVKMPRMNGLKASRIITRSFNIPIILLTAYSQRDLVEEAKDAHIAAYLVKPVSESDLIPALEIVLAQQKRISALHKDIRTLEKRMETRKLVERAKGQLMKVQGLTEDQAYQRIRKISMNQQRTMESVAKEILTRGKESVIVNHV